MDTMRERRRNAAGFTLLELLLVVIIIGILASVALPQLTGFAERSVSSEALQVLSALRDSQLRYKVDKGGGLYADDLHDPSKLDAPLPTADGVPPPGHWGYSMSASNILLATRQNGSGDASGAVITVNLDTGKICTDKLLIYKDIKNLGTATTCP